MAGCPYLGILDRLTTDGVYDAAEPQDGHHLFCAHGLRAGGMRVHGSSIVQHVRKRGRRNRKPSCGAVHSWGWTGQKWLKEERSSYADRFFGYWDDVHEELPFLHGKQYEHDGDGGDERAVVRSKAGRGYGK